MNSDIGILKERVLHCTKCELAQSRQHVIFGEGNTNAEILIIGEAPGRDEDLQGRPFVGKSGQLLDQILAACGFTRAEHVFISNIVKCRPPDNGFPSPQVDTSCMPWLLNQIELVNPEIIVLLGSTALKYFTEPDRKITLEHGKWFTWQNRLVMPVYHPAALLRNPSLKRDTWEDFKKVIFKYRELVNPQHYSANA